MKRFCGRTWVTLWVLVLGVAHLTPIMDTDYWWHVTTGRDVLHDRIVSHFDVYSHTFYQHVWNYTDWLGGAFWGLAYTLLGIHGSIVFKAILLTVFYGMLAIWGWRKTRDPWRVTLGILSIYFCLRPYVHPNPQLLSFLLFSLSLFLLHGVTSSKARWAIPLIQVLWVNIHRSAILHPAYLFLVLIFSPKEKRRGALLLFLCTLAATCVHPHLSYLISSSLQVIGSGDMHLNVTTWEGLSSELAIFVFFPIWIAALWLLRKPKGDAAEMMFGALLILGSMRFARFMPYASLVLIPIAFWRKDESESADKRWPIVSIVLMLLVVMSWVRPGWIGRFRSDRIRLGISSTFPVTASEFIRKQFFDAKIFNRLDEGGYLIFDQNGKNKVWIDGRMDWLYPFSFLRESVEATRDWKTFERMTTERPVDLALLPYRDRQGFETMLTGREGWLPIYFDDEFMLYLRKGSEVSRGWVPMLDAIDFKDPFASLQKLHSNSVVWKEVRTRLGVVLGYAPESFKAVVLNAYAASLDGDREAEKGLLRKALELNPNYELARRRLGQ